MIGLWLAIFLPLATYPFLSDDYVFLSLSRGEGSASWPFFRPLFLAAFSILARLGGESAAWFHGAAFALHLASGALVAILASRLCGATGPALFSFAVFVLNPVQLEAVLWVSGLQEGLWTFFILAALVCYTGTQALSPARLALTLVLVTGGLLSKETAACFIVLLPAADWALFSFRRGRTLLPAYALFGSLLGVYVALRWRFAGFDAGVLAAPSAYGLKEFLATPYQFFAQPWNAAAVAMPPFVPCVAALAAIALTFAGVMRGGGRLALAGAVIVLASTLPVGGYFFVASDLRHARYLYFPSVGWAVLLAALVSRVAASRGAVLGVTAAYAAAAAAILALNLGPWRTVRDLMDALAAGVRQQQTIAAATAEWSGRTGHTPVLRDGIPTEHQGVWILLNGEREFEAYVRRHSSSR